MEGWWWSWKRQIESAQIKLARQKRETWEHFKHKAALLINLHLLSLPVILPNNDFSPWQPLLRLETTSQQAAWDLCLLWRNARKKLIEDFSTRHNIIKFCPVLNPHTVSEYFLIFVQKKNFKSVLRVEYVLFYSALSKRFSSRYELRVYLKAHLSYLSPNKIVYFFKNFITLKGVFAKCTVLGFVFLCLKK